MARLADTVLQLKVTLRGIRPPIWRRIQVPALYSFWDLHVAIQDAMGWLDCHLHQFDIGGEPYHGAVRIGIPADDFPGDELVLPGWKVPVRRHLGQVGARAYYTYDFGDDWRHLVVLEKILEAEPGVAYPRCVAGRRRCPPEDVGGTWGYLGFLDAIRDPAHGELDEHLTWVARSFDPEEFSPASVGFGDPFEAWQRAFLEP